MQVMKKNGRAFSGLILVYSVISFTMAIAEPATISWDPNSENDLAGYRIYYGMQSGNYDEVIDVGNVTSFTINNLPGGTTYYFAVTAYDLSGNESTFSKEVSAFIGSIDTNPPELVAVVPRGETQIDVIFSESLDKASAEVSSNYSISNGIEVLGAILDADETTVHLITTTHERGKSYTLTVSNVKDKDGNEIPAGSSKSFNLPDPNQDHTAPELIYVVMNDETNLDVSFNEPITKILAEDVENYTINNGIQILAAKLADNQSIVHLTTTQHHTNTDYTLTVNNIKDLAGNAIRSNSTFTYRLDSPNDGGDNVPPELVSINVKGATQIDVNFSEPVNKATAETKNNYSIDNNIEVIGAVRDANLTTVHLITSSHKNGIAYTLTINNVEDYAGNKISTNSRKQYTFNFNDFPEVPGDKEGQTPTNFSLFQNYPNPFNPETEIRFYLDESHKIDLKIYNPLGQLIKTLVQDEMSAGFHTVVWDGTNENGLQAPTGVYIYSLEFSRNVLKGNLLVNVSLERRVRRMTLIR